MRRFGSVGCCPMQLLELRGEQPQTAGPCLNFLRRIGMRSTPETESSQPKLRRQDGVCTIKKFDFASGERLAELRLHYTTLGTPECDAAGQVCNAVLLLHASTGNRLQWLNGALGRALFGSGQVLDASRYFIIVPDLIGHGQSSKPSDGLRTRFPHYRCQDLAAAAHLLVTQGLKISRLQLVMGVSLGAMVTWGWGQMYPESAARLVPIGAYPLPLGGRNWIGRRMMIEAIRHDPAWVNGDYEQRPTSYLYTAPLLQLMAHGVQQLLDLAPDQRSADRYYEELLKRGAQHDPNDLLYILEATQDYDPSPGLERTTVRVLAINFEGDEICRPEISEQHAALNRLPDAQFVVVPATRYSRGHHTYYLTDTWKAHLAAFLGQAQVSSQNE